MAGLWYSCIVIYTLMCKHADNTQQIIDSLNIELYPRLQQQLDTVLRSLPHVEGPYQLAIAEVFADFRQTFLSLAGYENRLVFPSVLRVFNHKKEPKGTPMPNVAELQNLTKLKAQKLLVHAVQLERYADAMEHSEATEALQLLCHTVLTDFVQRRQDWNNMIDERMRSCNCFLQFQQLLTPTTHRHASL
ncbi:MAG: hypothetical protein EAY75_06415 [Bacteroidetes bacterium]|nr:MAG: hypothetical protein EAY75_06415 [Bacteroidota bacterium]